ncbi:MAG: sugar phosphate isomerase/epimerase family protein, partial [Solirubrobacteraceae bacterium]
MKLGFVTACLPRWSLAQLADWAAAHGYRALEVAAWPRLGNRPFTATHLDVDALRPDEVRALVARRGLEISSVAFMDNPLDPDLGARAAMHAHLHK